MNQPPRGMPPTGPPTAPDTGPTERQVMEQAGYRNINQRRIFLRDVQSFYDWIDKPWVMNYGDAAGMKSYWTVHLPDGTKENNALTVFRRGWMVRRARTFFKKASYNRVALGSHHSPELRNARKQTHSPKLAFGGAVAFPRCAGLWWPLECVE